MISFTKSSTRYSIIFYKNCIIGYLWIQACQETDILDLCQNTCILQFLSSLCNCLERHLIIYKIYKVLKYSILMCKLYFILAFTDCSITYIIKTGLRFPISQKRNIKIQHMQCLKQLIQLLCGSCKHKSYLCFYTGQQ